MLSAAADRRYGEEILVQMNVSAAATGAGFTGNSKPLEGIERAIRGSANCGNELQRRLKGFAQQAGALLRKNGPHGR